MLLGSPLTGAGKAPVGTAAATAAPIVGAEGAGAGPRGAGSTTALELAPAPVIAPLELAEPPLEAPAPISLMLSQEKKRSSRL